MDARRNASAACWQLYGDVTGYELAHLAELGPLHQLTVDAYAAQHAGPTVPAISTAFALVGLWLALEDGMSGTAVRAAHQHLAQHFRSWPAFAPPVSAPAMTVFDVAAAESVSDHARLVRRWAVEAWEGWRGAHDEVARLVAKRLPIATRDRLRHSG